MKSWIHWLRIGAVTLVSIGGIVVLLIWLAGGFHTKIEPGPARIGLRPLGSAATVAVEQVTVPLVEEAVGTVQATHETEVGAKILARVLAVHFQAGQRVEADQVLVELAQNDLEARLSQARSAVDAAQAALSQAQTNYDRIERLREQGAASKLEFTTATNDLSAARARHEQALSAVTEAETVLEYATIRAPVGGVVIDKSVDVGDMVQPGQTVLRLFDQLQLVATVRESLATTLELGQQLPVTLEALNLQCHGTVNEIVPESNTLSRAFLVKVTGPCPAGVIPGMFGRLHLPLGARQELQIPRGAVLRVGQLPYVYRVVDGTWIERTFIRIGREYPERLAVTSGLAAGDLVVTAPEVLGAKNQG